MKESRVEHGFQKFSKALKSQDISSVVIITGDEKYLVDWAIQSLIDKFVNKAVEDMDKTYFSVESLDVEKIKEACETMPFMSERKVVIVQEKSLKNNGESKIKKSQLDEIIEYLNCVPEMCLLILSGRAFENNLKQIKKIDGIKHFNFETLFEKDLKLFIKKRFKENNKEISPAVLNRVIQNSGYFNRESNYNLYDLQNDISKISAYSSSDEISLGDVETVISGNIESHIFALIESISIGRKDHGLILLKQITFKEKGIYRILSLIISQFEIMLKVKDMKDDGYSFLEMKKFLKIHEYRIKKASSVVNRYTSEKLKKILIKAYEIDKEIKTGMLDENLAMEIFIASI